MTPLDPLISAFADAVAARMEQQPPRKRLYTLEEAAQYLGLSEESVERLVRDGRLRAVRLTRKLLFDVADLDRLIDSAKNS